jgi:hypothetical protein
VLRHPTSGRAGHPKGTRRPIRTFPAAFAKPPRLATPVFRDLGPPEQEHFVDPESEL